MVKQFLKERLGTIIILAIIAIFVIVGLISVNEARKHAITYKTDYTAPEKTADPSQTGEYKLVATSENLELYYNDVKGAIRVKNLENGYVWNSVWPDELCPDINVKNPGKKLNKEWTAVVTSPIHLKYSNLQKRDSAITTVYVAKDCGSLETEYIDGGVSVTYGFLTPGIYVTVEYTVENGELVVRIPHDKIEELSKYAINSITVLPFLGACENTEGGYLFYPDGSGAITSFDRASERAKAKSATYYTYSTRNVSYNDFMTEEIFNRYTSSLPVCGIKNGDNAMLAYATENEQNTAVVVNPVGTVITLNYIGFEVYVRNSFSTAARSVTNSADSTKATDGTIQRVDKKLLEEDKEIRYSFLSGDKANYSGMASEYRNYLLRTGQLVKNDELSGYPLGLRLLMGTTKAGIVFDEYITMTDYEQVVEILQSLKEKGVSETELVLENWQKNSGDYEVWGPAGQLGGSSGLKSVSKYVNENGNVSVYLEASVARANSDTSGLNADKDVAYDGLHSEITAERMDGVHEYILNPRAAAERTELLLGKLKKYTDIGIAFADLGKYVYADYNESYPYTKSETIKTYQKLLATAGEASKKSAINGSNQYLMSVADYMYNVSEDCFGLAISDYSVPFLQMVVSGIIPYSSDKAGNLAYDLQIQKLKWAEFGSMPYFYLTYESALELRKTGNDELFSSTYADWEPVMIDTYNEFKNNFGDVYNRQIVEHKIFTEDVRKTVYDNGTTVYVNYGKTEAFVEGITIPAKDYVVAGGAK